MSMTKLLLVLCLLLQSFAAFAAFAAEAPVKIFLAGDSTLSIKRPEKRPETGWGEYLDAQFAPGRVVVDNRAMNGRSTRTFIEEGRWQALVDDLRAGDTVLIQFGHNDQSVEKRDRYTPPDDYRRNLMQFVVQVRARNATPVLVTPVARRRFDDAGRLLDSHGEYPQIVRDVARAQQVALIDLQRRSEAVLAETGVEGSKRLFLWLAPGESANYPDGLSDNTHFSPLGARRMAAEVAAALRGLGLLSAASAANAAEPATPSLRASP
jgi:lysophospholipase L1-like esterase